MTHDLLKSVFTELGSSIRQIVINDLRESTFFARIVVDQGSHTIEVDARPSDAIALAVRSDVPIFVEDHVFEQASTPYEEEEEEEGAALASESASEEPETEVSDEGLSLFRDFINSLDKEHDEGRKDK
jgi:bifunctional DNase/RNase